MHKMSLHDDVAVGKLLPQCFLRALCAYERAGVKNFTKKIVRQNSRVDTTVYLQVGYCEDQVESTWYNSQVSLGLDLSKRGTVRNSRQNSMMDTTLALEIVFVEKKVLKFDPIPE